MKRDRFKPRLTVIYEGKSERYFFDKLESIFDIKYDLSKVEAHGDNRIPFMYRKEKRKNFNDVKVMYDLDGTTSVSDIIKTFKVAGVSIKKEDIYFINPDIELLFILCKIKKAKLINNKTKKVIEDIYNFSSYDKNDKQIKKIIDSISKEELIMMFELVNKYLSKDDKSLRSTNYDVLLKDIFDIG